MANKILSKNNKEFSDFARPKFNPKTFEIKPRQTDVFVLSETIAKACDYTGFGFESSVINIKHRINQIGYSLVEAEFFAVFYSARQYEYTPLSFATYLLRVDKEEDALEIIYRNNMDVSEDKKSVLSYSLLIYMDEKRKEA